MRHYDHPAPAAWVGIDISKDTLDACLLPEHGRPRCRRFSNEDAGHAALLAWADAHAPGAGFCLESTGAYGAALATTLAEAGRHVSVVNPARIKYAGLARGRGNKTDKADARLIAEYAARERPAAWRPAPAETRELQALVRRRDDLRQLAAREKGRLAVPGLSDAARESVSRTVAFLEAEGDRLGGLADDLIAGSAQLREDRALLESIPGVGAATAQAILAELPAVGQVPSAEAAAAYAGLAPRQYQSGTTVRKRTRLSKAGSARLRKALYLPALTAIQFNPLLKALYERLTAAGKAKMAAVGACMRKLLMIAYGVLKNRAPFDPSWASKRTP
ncbi:MAG TPA: IS110 family transposase [Gemmataceae bacterium]|nr:IS110 family transposase [Gemmataceae bacterium]